MKALLPIALILVSGCATTGTHPRNPANASGCSQLFAEGLPPPETEFVQTYGGETRGALRINGTACAPSAELILKDTLERVVYAGKVSKDRKFVQVTPKNSDEIVIYPVSKLTVLIPRTGQESRVLKVRGRKAPPGTKFKYKDKNDEDVLHFGGFATKDQKIIQVHSKKLNQVILVRPQDIDFLD